MTEKIEIYGDTYYLRGTFDIVDYRNGIYGFDVFDDNREFLFHYDTDNIDSVISEIKWNIYRSLS